MLSASVSYADQREQDRRVSAGPRADWQAVTEAVALAGQEEAAADIDAAVSAMTDEELYLGYDQMDLIGAAEAFIDVAEAFDALNNSYPAARYFTERDKAGSGIEKAADGDQRIMTPGLPGAVGYPTAPAPCPFSPERSNADALLIAVDAIAAAGVALEVAEGIWSVSDRACTTVVVAIGAAGNPQNAVCIAADVLLFAAKAVLNAAQATVDHIAFCDGAVDSAEIEGAYERAGHIHDDLAAHDSDIKTAITTQGNSIEAAIAAHDANIDADLAAHDANIDGDLAAHDTHIDTDLAAHDAHIDSDLAAHDAHINSDLEQHDADVKALLATMQATLDNEIEKTRVHMQVMQIIERARYLVSTKEAGLGVPVDFLAIEVFNPQTSAFQAIPTATATPIEPGLYDLMLNMRASEHLQVFRLRVRHNDEVDHFGEIMFSRASLESDN
jgi:hypothetical protein